ncbi:class I SAM-dependent methyltransferase [Acidovorax sp. SUPP1855]|uniref:class I SAM-dependent methyltransferase n=1 Tax=Acidovorax sp. SUPP1855 TaxID=431774 RepID=UPI0023DE69A3|nr:class I SAM-dependent methyltransferase [Acidovorax sp. SUPP1855]GKS84100.1 class I SAM-dependent methyltransferase [Acidovorax sp. SUPP1855]
MNDLTAPPQKASDWLALGIQHLERDERVLAAEALRHALQDRETRLTAHQLIEQHTLPGAFSQMMGLNCEIARADDIFRFFEGHPSSTNPLRDYLADGWRTLSELMALLEAVDRPLLKTPRFMEFASGHGRFTRHLVKALGADRVTVSDVVPDAMAFAQRTFGVRSVLSSTVPESLVWDQQYDVVFVLSLFSHLPRRTWSRWLHCLYDGVAPGGVLVFSTHGLKAAAHDSVALDEDGFFFAPSSESQAIDVQEYGTAFTSEDFVLARIAETVGADKLVHRSLVHFWNHQDAYVLAKP